MQELINGWCNEIPLAGLILENLVALIMIYLSFRIFLKYKKRKNRATLYLFFSFLFYGLGAIITVIFTYIQFFSNVPGSVVTWANLGISSGYIFTSTSNCFLFAFVNDVFLDWDRIFNYIYAIANGIVIGLIIPHISYSPTTYQEISDYFHLYVLFTIIVYILLIVKSLKESKKSVEKLPKLGFRFIAYYAITIIFVFVFFAIDALLGGVGNIYPKGYSPFFYVGWSLVIIAFFFGYLGYVMPQWFRKLINA